MWALWPARLCTLQQLWQVPTRSLQLVQVASTRQSESINRKELVKPCPTCSASGNCNGCGGSGEKGHKKCSNCNGSGDCPTCQGAGKVDQWNYD